MEICKKNGTYLSGNINLSNLSSACPDHAHKSPYWIGVFREKYLNTDQGNEFIEMRMNMFDHQNNHSLILDLNSESLFSPSFDINIQT